MARNIIEGAAQRTRPHQVELPPCQVRRNHNIVFVVVFTDNDLVSVDISLREHPPDRGPFLIAVCDELLGKGSHQRPRLRGMVTTLSAASGETRPATCRLQRSSASRRSGISSLLL